MAKAGIALIGRMGRKALVSGGRKLDRVGRKSVLRYMFPRSQRRWVRATWRSSRHARRVTQRDLGAAIREALGTYGIVGKSAAVIRRRGGHAVARVSSQPYGRVSLMYSPQPHWARSRLGWR